MDGDRLKISPTDAPLRRSQTGGVNMGATITVARKPVIGKPPRPPRARLDPKAKTLQGIKRKGKKKKATKPLTAMQRLLKVAREQHLQTEEARIADALAAWE